MPRVRRKAKLHRARWTREQLDYVNGSMETGPTDWPFNSDNEARTCWQDTRVKTLEWYFERFVGCRPKGFYLFDLPETAEDGFRYVANRIALGWNHCWFLPEHLFDEPATELEGEPWALYELEIVFLYRHNLLWEGEIERYQERGRHDEEYGLLPLELRPKERPEWFYRDREKDRREWKAVLAVKRELPGGDDA